MNQNKDDRTQVVDLGLGAPSLRVSGPSGSQQGAAVAFDLGSGQQSAGLGSGQGAVPPLAGSGSFNSAQNLGSSFGDTSQNAPTIGFQHVFTQDVKLVKEQKLSPGMQVAAALSGIFLLLIGFAWYKTGDLLQVLSNPVELLNVFDTPSEETEMTAGDDQSSPVPENVPPTSTTSLEKNTGKAQAKEALASSPATDLSLWNDIKNELGSDLPARGSALTSDQEAMFKAGLSHEFNYQRYKTVLDLAAINAPGTEELLRQALESKKFWMRMRALIALADMGDPITDDDVRVALGDAHSELRARFFKRFEKSACSVGCFFVARAAMKHLDAHGRQQALKVVSREASRVRDVFMAAATFDQHETVRKTAQDRLLMKDIDPAIWQEVKSRYGLAH